MSCRSLLMEANQGHTGKGTIFMTSKDSNSRSSVTYADAGVDIDAGNALVNGSNRRSSPPAGLALTARSADLAACSI